MTHAQMVALYNALLAKLHLLRQQITSLHTGDPIFVMPPVGISGQQFERLQEPAVALFEMNKLAREIRELSATLEQMRADRSVIDHYRTLPHDQLHGWMRDIAKEFELHIRGE